MFFWFNQDAGNFQWFKDKLALVPDFMEVMKDPELGVLVMRWIAAMYDSRSPYYHLDERERLLRTSKDIFKRKSLPFNITNSKVSAACDAYKNLYLDSDVEQYRSYELAINSLSKRMAFLSVKETLNEDERGELVSTSKAMSDLNKGKKEIHKIILERIKNDDIGMPNFTVKGGKAITFLESVNAGYIKPEDHAVQ